MSLNNVVSVPDYAIRLAELATKAGKFRTPPLPEVDPTAFKHVITARQTAVGGNPAGTTPAQLIMYAVPSNSDFILTYINVRTILQGATPVATDELVSSGAAMRPNLFLNRNGKSYTLSQSYLCLANRPVLFLFNSSDVISLVMDPGVNSFGFDVAASFEGFLAPVSAQITSRISSMQTTIANATTVALPSGQSQQSVTNTPF